MNPMQQNKTNLLPVRRPCRARTRSGGLCRNWTVRGRSRCRMHGGKSTGPRTSEGLERSRKARWKHGRYSAKTVAKRRRRKAEQRKMNAIIGGFLRGRGRLSARSIYIILPILENESDKLSLMQLCRISSRLSAAIEAMEKE